MSRRCPLPARGLVLQVQHAAERHDPLVMGYDSSTKLPEEGPDVIHEQAGLFKRGEVSARGQDGPAGDIEGPLDP